ncbi:hypothetical protein B296_00026899 [Ensete ventricosum]|uniref:Uncharacterized protein n=1 Tax=Ensete ventricosum TaxID=4639 RepID=A0A426YMD9_ENSVE|nr:hypothetical protein B296_00026899 [Ensete ventricosum]
MVKHHGESSKMGQAGPLLQAAAGGLQVQTRSQTTGVAYEEPDSEQDEREVGYSPRGEEAPSGVPTGKKGHRERDLQWRKPASMFLKRAWRNSTKAKEGYLG